MRLRKVILILLGLFAFSFLYAQQEPQFSQNMFNKLANNPGFAGSNGAICATVLHRSQYMGLEGAPKTLNFSVDAPMPFLRGGVGLNVVKDGIGPFSTIAIKGIYAYRTEIGSGQLGAGISLGMYQSGIDGGYLRYDNSNGIDQALPEGNVQGSKLDFGAGLYFNTQDAYIGVSTAHITEPVIEWSDASETFNLERHYFLISGYYYAINPTISINPSIYLKSDGATSQLDINTNVIYNDLIWSGVSYRLNEGLVALAGMNITDDLKFGLAYDITIGSELPNSLEFMLGYCFKIKYTRPDSKYKNPRFL